MKISLYITVRLLRKIKEYLSKLKDILCLWTEGLDLLKKSIAYKLISVLM